MILLSFWSDLNQTTPDLSVNKLLRYMIDGLSIHRFTYKPFGQIYSYEQINTLCSFTFFSVSSYKV